MNILIVDDDCEVGSFVAEVLQRMGMHTTLTATSAEFLDTLTPEFQVIFLDLVLPQVDGVELLRKLSQRDCKAALIMMSGLGPRIMQSAEELGSALGLHIAGRLAKPFRRAEIESLVRNVGSVPGACTGTPRILPRLQELLSGAELQAALTRHEFVPYFQPQIDLRSRTLVGVEALARWRHPQLGVLCPVRFLPSLGAANLMEQLQWEMVSQGLEFLQHLAADHVPMPTLSINIASDALKDLTFPDTLAALLRSRGIPAESIVLEITEYSLIEELSSALDVLTRLRMKGIRLSVDDFGTGYAMMQQLRHIPATELKIDRSFVMRLPDSAGDRVMVQKIIEMGHDLGMKVVAEGVETLDQFELLTRLGCDVAQGYFMSQPLPELEIRQWMSRYDAEQDTPAHHPDLPEALRGMAS